MMQVYAQVFSGLRWLAQTVTLPGGAGSYNTGLPKVSASNGNGYNQIQVVLQLVFGALGATALIILLIAAIKYIVSNGDPQDTAKAKETIIYAAVGLALALSAEIIVTFVLNAL